MYHVRRLVYVATVFTVLVFLLWFLPRALNPVKPSREKQEADRRWVDTSHYWLDRQACRWLSLCGLLHVKSDPPEKFEFPYEPISELRRLLERSGRSPEYAAGRNRARAHRSGRRQLKEIPQYVLDYAPLVHLYSGEHFWPSDIADHIEHMAPYAYDGKLNTTAPLSLANLDVLHSHSMDTFLTSEQDVETRPEWLHSKDNTPSPFGQDDLWDNYPQEITREDWSGEGTTWFDVDRSHPLHRISDPRKMPAGISDDSLLNRRRSRVFHPHYQRSTPVPPPIPQYKPDDAGYSRAPATLVLVDKGSGIVDAFWFFFYAYNLGQTVLGVRFGNHVGDWEHTMIRFESGVPRAIYFSEHEGGQAYAWQAVEKYRLNRTAGAEEELDFSPPRPVVFSAVGSHAMYAAPGDHPYVLPFNLLRDVTDRGPLWDPAKNFRSYWYDYTVGEKLHHDTTNDSPSEGDSGDRGLEPTLENPNAPTGWFHYLGRWGDKLYGLNDLRQYRIFGQYHYVTGPQGPKSKNLGREKVCQLSRCKLIHSIDEGRRGSWHS